MKAEEVLRRYANGQRDFRSANLRGQSFRSHNLSGANFSQTDIRGTDFSHAILIGANFTSAIAGLQNQWIVGQVIALIIAAMVFGAVEGYSVVYLSSYFSDKIQTSPVYSLIALLAISVAVVFITAIVRKGSTIAAVGHIIIIAITAGICLTVLAVTGFGANAIIVVGALAGIVASSSASGVITTIAGAVTDRAAGMIASLIAMIAIASAYGIAAADLFIVACAVAIAAVSVYISRLALQGDPKFALVHQLATAIVSTGGTTFWKANLEEATFTQASLKSTDFRHAILTCTQWMNSQHLDRARLDTTYLHQPNIRQLVTTLQGQHQTFDGFNLTGIFLQNATLHDASFVGTVLNHTNLQHADLSRANLKQAQLDGADLTGACLTAAYLEYWGITNQTKLDQVRCDYVYMHVPTKADPDPVRKPDNRKERFEAGDFADFIRPIVDTLDLYHNQGVDPRAIAIAFKDLTQDYPEAELELVAMEKRGNGKFLLRAKTAPEIDKSELSTAYFTHYNQLRALPRDARLLLLEKDSRIHSLEQMIATALQQPTFAIQGDFMPDNNPINIHAGGDISGAVNVNLGQISGNVTNTIQQLQQSNAVEAIQLAELLKQLQHAIEAETELKPEEKADALEQVTVLAEVGQNPQQPGHEKLGRQAITFLKGSISALSETAKLAAACKDLLPLITKAMGLPF